MNHYQSNQGLPPANRTRIGEIIRASACGLVFAASLSSNIGILIWSYQGRYVVEAAIPFVLITWAFLGRGIVRELLETFRGFVCIPVIGYLVFCAFIGILRHHDVINAYADIRASAGLVFAALFLGRHWRNENFRFNFLCSALIFGGFFDIIAAKWRISESDVMQDRSAYNIMAMYALIVLGVQARRVSIVTIGFGILAYMALTGFFRQYYLILGFSALSLVAIAMALLISNRSDARNRRFSLGLIALIVLSGGASLAKRDKIFDFLTETQSRAVHSVQRTSQLMEAVGVGDLSVENERANSLRVLEHNLFNFVIPHGSGWRAEIGDIQAAYGGQYGILSTMDSGYLFLAYHYGTLALVLFLAGCFWIVRNALGSKRELLMKLAAISGVALVVGCLSLEAGMFSIVPRAISYGMLLAVIISPVDPDIGFAVPQPIFRSGNGQRSNHKQTWLASATRRS